MYKQKRQNLLPWDANATVGDDGCITVELYNGSKESVLLLDVAGVNKGNLYITK